jgi:hypothetical protein
MNTRTFLAALITWVGYSLILAKGTAVAAPLECRWRELEQGHGQVRVCLPPARPAR